MIECTGKLTNLVFMCNMVLELKVKRMWTYIPSVVSGVEQLAGVLCRNTSRGTSVSMYA